MGRGTCSLCRCDRAGSLLLASAYTEAGRRGEIAATSLAYTRDAFCILCLGRLDEALLKLEQSKAHLLAEALAIGETELESLPAAQQEALKTVRQAVRMYEAEQRLPLDTPARRNDREIAEDLSTARARLWEIINNIRTQRPDFMPTGLNLQGLLKLIPEGGALVAPIVTSRGTAVFVLPHGVESVSAHHVILLERLTDSTLSNVLFGSAYSPQMGGWIVANMECRNNPERWFQIIEKTGGSLWEMLLEPVHKCLKDLKLSGGAPVLLLPQGGLGLLPLHASWCKVDGQRHYFLDDYTVTYAPSGFALDVSLQRLQEPQRRQRSLLVVANPTVDLMFASNECQHVAAFFREDTRRCLTEHEATLEEIVQVTPGKAYMHFSCHGFFNWKDPMQSGLLCAGNVPLTLSLVIGKLDLNACRLVVLSACETGLTDIRQSPDEYLGLPAGFLQAGAPAVVSTLWAVADLSTAILFRQFYHYHLKEKLEPATALSKAQRWLRDATAEDMGLAGYYEDVYRESGRSNSVALTWARYYSSNPDTRPFNHPFYWAGFIFSGA